MNKEALGPVLLFVHRIGPYHAARFRALALGGFKFEVVELSGVDQTYAWRNEKKSEIYRTYTLFPDADVDQHPPSVVWRKITEFLDSVRPSCSVIPGWSSAPSLAALAWCVSNGVKAVLLSDSTELDEPRALLKELIKGRIVKAFSAAFVAGAPHVKYVVQLGMHPELVRVGYDAVDNDYFARGAAEVRRDAENVRLRHNLPKRYFLSSARFVEKKNLLRLIQGYSAFVREVGVSAPDLVLLGDGPIKPIIVETIATEGLFGKVHLPGFIQYDQLPEFYGLADAFVHASTVEQWGLVVNEAMASSLPVVVSERCGCAADLIKPGVNGYVFDPYSCESIAASFTKLYAQQTQLRSMGAASSRIIQDWSLEAFRKGLQEAVRLALYNPSPNTTRQIFY